MKILLVTRDVKDGIGTTVKNLVWQYEKNPKIELITVICPEPFKTFSNKTKFIHAPIWGKYFFTKESIFAYKAYKAITKEVNKNEYDVIHLHSNILSFAFKNKERIVSTFQGSHSALIRNVRVPIISTFHSTKKATFSNIDLTSLKYRFGKYLHLPFILLDQIRLKNSDLITCVSKYTLKELEDSASKKGLEKNFIYIPNGIDIEIYKPLNIDRVEFLKNQYGIDIGMNKVGLYIGRLEAGKGVLILAEAVKDIPNFTLLIAGVGDEMSNLQSYSNIKCLGYISDQVEKNKLLNSVDVFVLPSLYENFPTVIPEAMAANRAIISTKVGMVPEILGHRDRVLVEIGNIEELREKIQIIITNEELNKSEASLNYEYAIKNLKWEEVSKIYYNHYSSLN